MPEIEHTAEIDRSVEAVWRYVERLENWAPLVVGFQRLEVIDDRRSIWTLRGDMGVLAREVDLQADITAWEPERRVTFTVKGLTEAVEGHGEFLLEDGAAGTIPGGPTIGTTASSDSSRGRPVRDRLTRLVLRWLTKRRPRTHRPVAVAAVAADPSVAGEGRARLTFRLQVSPGGPMAPMVELLMSPMLRPAAEDLASGIRDAIEGRTLR